MRKLRTFAQVLETLLTSANALCEQRWQIIHGLPIVCVLSIGITMSACGGGCLNSGPGVCNEPGVSADPGTARLTTPADGATGVSQFEKFTWNQVPDAMV